MNKLAEAFPNSQFTGYDFSAEAIATANAEAQQQKLSNIQFQVKDAAKLDECDRYDFITTFDAIHDQAQPDVVLQNILQQKNHVQIMCDRGTVSACLLRFACFESKFTAAIFSAKPLNEDTSIQHQQIERASK